MLHVDSPYSLGVRALTSVSWAYIVADTCTHCKCACARLVHGVDIRLAICGDKRKGRLGNRALMLVLFGVSDTRGAHTTWTRKYT